ncbi:MAG TPA: hypothetical protein EYP85_04400 [Armatimonadetes bacterium]|nr:hypothetical protein [Armatimonadota bacterium]
MLGGQQIWKAAILLVLAAVTSQADELRLQVPRLTSPPAIEGRVDAEEWRGAAAVTGFVRLKDGTLARQETTAFLGYDDRALYVAFRCAAPEPPQAQKRAKDEQVFLDDAVEVLVDVDRTRRRHFQFIGNAAGSVWDSIGDDPAWDATWQFAARPTAEGWEAEFALPFAALETATPKVGHRWGLNLARDALAGGREHSSLAQVQRSFHETERFAELVFGNAGEGLQVLSWGRPWRGEVEVRVRAPQAAEVQVALDGEKKQAAQLAPGEEKTLSFSVEARGSHQLSLRAEMRGKEVLAMERKFEREPEVPMEIVRRFLTAQAVDVQTDLRPFAGKRVGRVAVQLVKAAQQVVREIELQVAEGGQSAQGSLQVAGIAPGDYQLQVRVYDAAGRELARENFPLTIPPRPVWLGSPAGLTDEVLSPWTPLKVKFPDSSLRVFCLGREYRLGEAGLPEEILTRDKQILAAPVRWEAVVGGKPLIFRGSPRLVEQTPARVVCQTQARPEGLQLRGRKAPRLELKVRTSVEYDGLMRFDVEFLPQGETTLDRLALLIPLRPEHAKYLHYWPGRWGAATNSFALLRSWSGPFRALIYLCDEERGLCWFAETDEPFDLQQPERAIEVMLPAASSAHVPQTLLRVNLFDHPVTLTAPRRWTFGLEATPVKPVPVAWWLRERIVHWGSYGLEKRPATAGAGQLVYPAEGNIDPQQGTLEAWLKVEFDPQEPVDPEVPRGNYNRSFFALHLANRNHIGFYWNIDDRGMRFYARLGEQYPIVVGAPADLQPGKWHHVALTWGDEICIYVDGKQTLARPWKGLFGGEVDLQGARMVIGGGRCDFVLDELRISRTARKTFDLTRPLPADADTLLLDRLDEVFTPNDDRTTRPERGSGGVPSFGLRFVEGRFGKGLQLWREGKKDQTYLDAARELGARTLVFHEHWTDIQNYTETTHGEALRSLVQALHQRGMRLAVYFGYEISDLAPEYPHYAQECLAWRPGMWYYTRQPAQKAYRVCYNSPWQDFLAAGIQHVLEKYDLDGVYLDGTASPGACSNRLHGCGYVGKDGEVHPTYPIFAARQMMKRIYTICYHHRPQEPFVNVHNSTGLYVPSLAFATSYWDGEQLAPLRHGDKPPLEILPLDTFRCEFMGHQVGVPADFLIYERRPFTYGEGLSFSLLHDVMPRPPGLGSYGAELARRIWSTFAAFGAQEAKWIPYWRSAPVVSTEPSEVYTSLYLRRGEGALAVVSNLGPKEAEVTLRFKAKALGLTPPLTATEHLTDTPLEVKGTTVRLTIPSLQAQVLWLRGR